MTLNRSRLMLIAAAVTLLLIALVALLVNRYQQRHVRAAEQLMQHLTDVAMGEVDLQPAYLQVSTLAPLQRQWLGEQLRADLRGSGHPDPDAAAEALLPRAGALLDDAAGLADALAPRLQALPEPPWAVQERNSKRWQVQAGDQCLSLVFQGSKAEALWQWQDFSLCSLASD